MGGWVCRLGVCITSRPPPPSAQQKRTERKKAMKYNKINEKEAKLVRCRYYMTSVVRRYYISDVMRFTLNVYMTSQNLHMTSMQSWVTSHYWHHRTSGVWTCDITDIKWFPLEVHDTNDVTWVPTHFHMTSFTTIGVTRTFRWHQKCGLTSAGRTHIWFIELIYPADELLKTMVTRTENPLTDPANPIWLPDLFLGIKHLFQISAWPNLG